MDDTISRREIIAFIIRLAAATAAGLFVMRKLVSYLDPTSTQKKKSQLLAEQILQKIGIKDIKNLTEYEMTIATHVVSSGTGTVWNDVGGYTSEINELLDSIILPLKISSNSKILTPPKGVLLYGPPGCGKTLIAKALANAAGARFINLQISTLVDKWYGESEKLAAAVFSLAQKLQPSIIFIDEIDSFLRSRSVCDHEATAMMKALFLSLWDGFATDSQHKVIVLGATNRPQDVDPAILRRMPTKCYIGLPDDIQRQMIFEVILRNDKVDSSVNLTDLARVTEGFSGSDLREVARLAAIFRIKDTLQQGDIVNDEADLRPISNEDLVKAIEKCKQCKYTMNLRLSAPLD